jgi:tetratricopeptide (TPR) repeat protein
MNNPFLLSSRLPSRGGLRSLLLGLMLVGCFTTGAFAQPQGKDQPKKELSDKVGEAFGGPIKTAKDANNSAEVLRLIEPLLVSSAPTSYDRAVLVVEKAQELIQINQTAAALAPLEEGLKLGDQYGYFDQGVTLEMVMSLAQIYGQEAQTTKQSDEQRRLFTKAYTYVRRWLDQSKTPNPEMEQFAASILLSQATLNPEKVDLGLVKQSEAETLKGMRMSVAPKEQFYVLLLAALQQEGDLKRSADVLERLVKMSPNNKTYWQPLEQTYIQLATDGENADYYLRAIIAIERAQQYGTLNTAKDNFTLVGIYLNMHQYDRAVELLDSGLHNGAIENTEDNWKLLAQSYQQLHKEPKAIESLKDASRRFPKSGEIDIQIGQLYYSLDKIPDAYSYLKLAVTKGNISHPGQTYVLLAYLAFELQKLDEALENVQKSLKTDPHSKDAQRLLGTITDSIKERDASKTPSL